MSYYNVADEDLILFSG